MLKDNAEYQQLLRLRGAIVGKRQAQERLSQARNTLNGMKFSLSSPSNRSPVRVHTQAMIKEFEAPAVDAAYKVARRRDRGINTVKNIFLILLAIGIVILGGFLIYHSAVWSWNGSIGKMITEPYMNSMIDYEVAVGIHLFALTFALAIGATILGFLGAGVSPAFFAGTVVFGLCGAVSFFASFSYYYAIVSGFWETLFAFIASFLFIPKFLLAFGYLLPFVLAVIGTPLLAGLLIFLCIKGTTSSVHTYKKPQIDLTELKATKEYKEAEERDRKATEEDLAFYRAYYNKEVDHYNKMLDVRKDAVAKYERLVQSCDKTIRSLDILHSSQKNLECIDNILYYFDMRRAKTIQEALNLYVQDQHMIRIQNQLSELQRETIRAMRQEVDRLSSRLDSMESAITQEIATVNRSINEQTATLDKSINELRKDNNRNADRMITEQSRIASELSHMYYLQRMKM